MRLLALLLCLTASACPSGGSTGTTTPDPTDQGDRTPQPDPDRCPLLACTSSAATDDSCPDPFLEFKNGSAEPNPLTMDLIEDLAAEIKATPSLRALRLDGHAGSGETEDLARERAQAVRGFLIDNGVRAELIEITGAVDPATADASYVTFEATDCGTPTPTSTDQDGESSVGAIDLVLQ
jgi:outer membrane protein OmpA-like peptidoglycan-associated protein